MSPEPTFAELLARAQPHADQFVHRASETIPLDTLADLGIAEDRSLGTTGLSILGTLGTGGMSAVRLAHQASLQRHVAVKTLRDDIHSPELATRLLQEARVTGYLEHPNVVPIHDVLEDDRGTPLVVLKRIEGHAWSDVIADPALVAELGDTEDTLAWHIGVLVAICRALEFAHDRGIVHRDIKPHNVMVGRFGEVTLLDWGVAVCLTGVAGLPRWTENDGVVGTPAYMAPEMLIRGWAPDARMDVYLLGATLFHVLTGRPPHRGRGLQGVVAAIRSPQPPDAGPESLRALCSQSMAFDPQARPTTVTEFRRHLERFLVDRDLDRVAAAATEHLVALRAAVASDADISALLATCRFGFGQVLASRPEHAHARARLDEALILAAGRALSDGHPARAQGYLDEALAPSPELLARIQAAQASQNATLARAERLFAIHDPRAARRTKTLIAAAAWIGSSIVPIVALDVQDATAIPLPAIAVIMGLSLVGGTVVMLWPGLVPNRLSRSFVALLAFFPMMQGLVELGLRMQGHGAELVFGMPLIVGAFTSVTGALVLDRKLAIPVVTYSALWLAHSADLLAATHAVGAGNSILGLCCFWVFYGARPTGASPKTTSPV